MQKEQTTKMEKIALLYERYGTMYVPLKHLCEIIGISKSKAEKLFFKYGEHMILEKHLLPTWVKIGGSRMWNLEAIVDWMDQEI